MKKIYLLLFLYLSSCAYNKNLHDKKYIKIYKKEVYDEYSILYGTQSMDTVVFVSKTSLLKDCGWNSTYINKEGLKEIANIATSFGDSIIFTYSTKVINNNFSVTAGGGKPGQLNNKYINTYSRYPYYINTCESFK